MLDVIKRLLAGQASTSAAADRRRPAAAAPSPADVRPSRDPAAGGEDPLRIAACVLLLELAYADDQFSPEERRHIEQAMSQHFALSAEDARQLMELADVRRKESVELHQFTSRLTEAYDEGQRLLLAEIMWRVVEADGKLSTHEDYLMRKLGRLLDLKPGYLSEARKRSTRERGQ